MNRKYVPLVVGFVALFAAACLCPGTSLNPSSLLGTASALAPTVFAGAAQTETAVAVLANGGAASATPQASDTPAATPTETKVPATATATKTKPPAASSTPTEAPALLAVPVTDACKLIDTAAVSAALGEKITKTDPFTGTANAPGCTNHNTAFTAGLNVLVADGEAAVSVQLSAYAELDAAKNCAQPGQASADAVKAATAEFEKLGLKGNARVLELLTWEATLIKDKGCETKYGFAAVPGLGDAAYADHFYVGVELGVVYRNALIYMVAFKKNAADKDMQAIEMTFMTDVIKLLTPQ